ncbi:MAG: hypothetical protein ABIN25_03405, partial [Ginsengibacter sp.]
MKQQLKALQDFIQQNQQLSPQEKQALLTSIKEADKEFSITEFKLDRTEKVKRTTAILLEETIEELEQKRRAVEEKNYELEIENALEKVRAIALSMKEPADMPEVCKIIATELDKLNIKEIRNVQTAIFYESKGTYMNYEYYAKHDKKIITETSYTNSEMHRAFADQMLKGKGEFFSTIISKTDLPGWIAYQKTTNVFIDAYLETAPSLSYYWFSLGPVALGISTYTVLSEEAINLFRRFLKVFELAYTRYLDIEQAIAQLREAKIEAALEKVRSRSLAMHKSDELAEVIRVVSEQLQQLQFSFHNVSFAFNNEHAGLDFWLASNADPHPLFITVPYLDNPSLTRTLQARTRGDNFFADALTAEENHEWIQHVVRHSPLKDVSDENVNFLLNTKGYVRSTFLMKHIILTIGNYFLIPYTSEQNAILKRFGNVFEQTYTRFLDLQKAEAQSRESQIQLALERVRARTMAMYHSTELAETSSVLVQQIKDLGFETWSCGFCIWLKDDLVEVWMGADSGGLLPPMMIPYKKEPTHYEIYKASLRGDAVHQKVWEGEALEEHYKYLKSIPSVATAIEVLQKSGLSLPSRQCYYVGFFKQGYLLLITKESNAEMHELSKRFAGVFEQTYTRFLDLQKAEAQAREARIETALERTRTQSMIMQHSKELDDTLRVFHEQVLMLGINSAFSFLWLPDEEKNNHIFWAAWAEENNNATTFKSKAINYPLDRNEPATAQCLIDWKSGEPVVSYAVPPESVAGYFAAWQELITGVEKLTPEHFTGGLYYVEAFMTYGCFGVMLENDLNENEKKILSRFALEFERAYTRFLDLQKAEAQAREAKIEAALESVRASSMAMHHSDELEKVVKTLSDKLVDLGLSLDGAAIFFFEKEKRNLHLWVATIYLPTPIKVEMPYDKDIQSNPIIRDLWGAIETGEDFINKSYSGKVKDAYFRFVYKNNESIIPEDIKIFQLQAKSWTTSFTAGKNSVIMIDSWTGRIITSQDFQVLKRFAKVFEQTYTRFLDLKKAEAQARESQVEAALENVRSASLAMHHSNQLKTVAAVMFKKLMELGLTLSGAFIFLFDKKTRDIQLWIATTTLSEPGEISIPFTPAISKNLIFKDLWNVIENSEQLFNQIYSGKEKNEYFRHVGKHNTLPQAIKNFHQKAKSWITSIAGEEHAALGFDSWDDQLATIEDFQILKRFSKVFDQAYTRFLDLQKAEAQARDSQIQLALERVRARTMAMQHSNELAEVAGLLFKQVQLLELPVISCGFNIWDKGDEACNAYMSDVVGLIQPPFKIPLSESPVFIHFSTSRQREESFYAEEVNGEALAVHYRYMLTLPVFAEIADNFLKAGFTFPDLQINNVANFTYGNLIFITDKPVPQSHDIFIRFAKVFEQTYTRFLDLQKAEAQARESQIEGSLERVRSKAMAMQKSEDLANAVATVFEELDKLDLGMLRCGIGIINKKNRSVNVWASTKSDQDRPVQVSGDESMDTHPLLRGAFNAWLNQEEYSYILQGKDLTDYYKTQVSENFKLPDSHSLVTANEDMQQYYFLATFQAGGLFAIRESAFSEEAKGVMKRFADVFNLTYTRFSDLQKAEAQARESQIELSLERLRAKTMAMHNSADV